MSSLIFMYESLKLNGYFPLLIDSHLKISKHDRLILQIQRALVLNSPSSKDLGPKSYQE
eukprot:UN22388